jgi:hypothetical protein
MLSILEAKEKKGFDNLTAGDKSWSMLQYEHEAR